MSVDRQRDLRPSYLGHRAMRIDAERLQTIVSSARPADAERLTDLASWYARLLAAQPLLLRVLCRLVCARAATADMPTAPPTATGATSWRFPP